MTSPKNRHQKSDMDIEKHREEGNWRRCLELAQQNDSDHVHLQKFLTAEAKLEIFLEEITKKYPFAYISKDLLKDVDDDLDDKSGLQEAKSFLKKCLEGQNDSPLTMDANLLLAKAYYISGDFYDALSYIRQSGIDTIANIDKSLPLRVIKLIAESFSVKGMSLEKTTSSPKKLKYIAPAFDLVDCFAKKNHDQSKDSDLNDYDSYKTQIECLNKASSLAMRYVQNIEKQRGPYFTVSLGHILDSAILKTHRVYLSNGHLYEAVDYCRRILNYCETLSTLHIRQFISKELSEILIKGLCRSVWRRPDFSNKHSSPSSYIGVSLFMPTEFEEEIILLLMLSEALTSRNVLLERSPDFDQARKLSLNNVMLIQDMFTMTLIPLKCYYIDNFERAMKFSFEVKHIWYQFALTLMESKKHSLRSLLTLKEVSRMDPIDPVPNLIAAKLCMVELNDYEEAITLIEDALKRYHNIVTNKPDGLGYDANGSMINNIQEIYGEQNLLHQIHLMLGISNALLYEIDLGASKTSENQHLKESLYHLNKSIEHDINGNNYLPYFHIALHLASQRALHQAIKYVRVSLLLNHSHLPSIQLLILCLTGLRHYDEAYDLCKSALCEFPSHLILLYIRAHLEEIVCENGKELALLTAKEILKRWRFMNSDEFKKVNQRSSYCSFMPNINYDTLSLRVEQTLSEVMSVESAQIHNDNGSLSGKMHLSHASSINGSAHLLFAESKHSWTFEIQIWLFIVDLFLKLDQITEAESCVTDESVSVFGQLSHQLMYIKGVISKKRGQWHDAKIYFQNAISINPKHAKALQQLGHTYYLLGNQISADKYLKDSLNVDPTVHLTWSYMGLVLDAIGEHERASECHLTSLRLEETSPLLPFSIIPRCVFE